MNDLRDKAPLAAIREDRSGRGLPARARSPIVRGLTLKRSAMHTRKTFCRFCHANCAIEVDIEGERAVAVRGDVSDPLFGGYTCMKGRELPAQANHPERLRSSRRRLPDG